MRARRTPGGGAQVWPRVPTAQAGGGRPCRGRAGPEQRETWLESGFLRGLGVPPRLARGGPASLFHHPLSGGVVLLALRAECAPRRRGGWKARVRTKRERGSLLIRVGAVLGRAGTRPGGARRRREGRAGGWGSRPQP